MFKHLKQDRKNLKTFMNSRKSIHNCCDNEINGKQEDMTEHVAINATKKKPTKKMPNNEEVFGDKPTKVKVIKSKKKSALEKMNDKKVKY